MTFYGSGLGDRLIDETKFPIEIKEFLAEEEKILNRVKFSFNYLIEVGCMQGRYLNWAIKHNKNYIGVDVIPSYIEAGHRRLKEFPDTSTLRCKFIHGNAEKIDTLLNWKMLDIYPQKAVLFFPFNSFGNMKNYWPVIKSIKRCGAPFLISTYSTTLNATQCRQRYYDACSYLGLAKIVTENGVKFISDDGLCTIAYHQNFLINLFKEEGIRVKVVHFAEIGAIYTSLNGDFD